MSLRVAARLLAMLAMCVLLGFCWYAWDKARKASESVDEMDATILQLEHAINRHAYVYGMTQELYPYDRIEECRVQLQPEGFVLNNSIQKSIPIIFVSCDTSEPELYIVRTDDISIGRYQVIGNSGPLTCFLAYTDAYQTHVVTTCFIEDIS